MGRAPQQHLAAESGRKIKVVGVRLGEVTQRARCTHSMVIGGDGLMRGGRDAPKSILGGALTVHYAVMLLLFGGGGIGGRVLADGTWNGGIK